MHNQPQRLKGFDYRMPFYYMVTIHAVKGLPLPFSALDENGCVLNAVTRAFLRIIRNFHRAYPDIHPITCFTIMPDHLHLLIRMHEGAQHGLIEVVENLKEALAQNYLAVTGRPVPGTGGEYAHLARRSTVVFLPGFHDYIVKREGQLARFTRYIRTNPSRAWMRRMARAKGWFNRIHRVAYAGQVWFAYGNVALLELPEIVPLKGHRATQPDSPEWQALVDRAARLGPGCAGVSTFMSPLEKACGHAIGLAGGNWIVLNPRGFVPSGHGLEYDSPAGEPTRWHPGEVQERWCAQGRIVYLSLWEGSIRRLDAAELGRRCHLMGALVSPCLPPLPHTPAPAPAPHPRLCPGARTLSVLPTH